MIQIEIIARSRSHSIYVFAFEVIYVTGRHTLSLNQ